jgi:molecular chaperone HscB
MKNFFELFSLPMKFDIDLDALEKKYFAFQQRFHPDKSSADDLSQSITINEAYKILSDDFSRACYLLKLNGVDILNDEKAVKVDFSTLERVLELQEKISEMVDKNEIESLRKELNAEFRELILLAMKALEGSEIGSSAQMMVKAKYLKKSLEDLKNRKQKI